MRIDDPTRAAQSRTARLRIYLNDHLAGAAGGTALAARIARAHRSDVGERELAQLAADVGEDRQALLEIMGQLGVARTYYKESVAAIAERVGRLKLNGSVVRRSPLSSVVELETMGLGVTGKLAGWRTLRELAESDSRLDKARLNTLIGRAEKQQALLEELRARAVRQALVGAV